MNVSYDHRAITIDGNRTLLLSGAIHYCRSTPAMWPKLMQVSREGGLNTIETYVFWNLHERTRGVYDFSGRLDLLRFCKLAQENGMHVILRIGPYVCSETNYGGFPAWLRDEPGIEMRTFNEPFTREMGRWMRFLCDYLKPAFAPQGGPIILAQIENEYGNLGPRYGEAGQKYLRWVSELSTSLGVGVPWVMCSGAAPGVLETINGFTAYDEIEKHRQAHPDQPAVWTEHWTGWYNTFGFPRHPRSSEKTAYADARFFAQGGTGVNYYMWHAGTNFGRESMYLQCPDYGFYAPLDEYGLPTAKYYHLSRLHHALLDYADVLLACERPSPEPLGPVHPGTQQAAYAYRSGTRSLVFLCNNDAQSPADVAFDGTQHHLPAESVTLIGDGRVLMNTGEVDATCDVKRTMKPLGRTALGRFTWWLEPLPAERPAILETVDAPAPIEQLKLTHDTTDYCWYTTKLRVEGGGTLALEGVGDVAHVFVDGSLAGTTPTPIQENRGPVDGDAFKQSFALSLEAGEHELSILCCAMGLIKHDCMIGDRNMAEERKGLWGRALWNGQPLPGPWKMQPGLVGEHVGVCGAAASLVKWKAGKGPSARPHLRWWQASFARPEGDGPFAVDLQGMTKGMLWLNGQCAGRYWLVPANGTSMDWLQTFVAHTDVGEPTQRYYHLPTEWLKDQNMLVLFDELGGDASRVRLCRWQPTKK